MIKRGISSVKKLVHFKRWARRRYAIFSSLGKDIKICRLRTDMCVGEEKKQGHVKCSGTHAGIFPVSDKNEEDTGIPDIYRHIFFPVLMAVSAHRQAVPVPAGRGRRYNHTQYIETIKYPYPGI